MFVTDVSGIFNIPPSLPNAKLLRELWVDASKVTGPPPEEKREKPKRQRSLQFSGDEYTHSKARSKLVLSHEKMEFSLQDPDFDSGEESGEETIDSNLKNFMQSSGEVKFSPMTEVTHEHDVTGGIPKQIKIKCKRR